MPPEMTEHRSDSSSVDAPAIAKAGAACYAHHRAPWAGGIVSDGGTTMADQATQMTESLRRTSPPKSAATAGVETNASAVRPFRVSVPDSELAEP